MGSPPSAEHMAHAAVIRGRDASPTRCPNCQPGRDAAPARCPRVNFLCPACDPPPSLPPGGFRLLAAPPLAVCRRTAVETAVEQADPVASCPLGAVKGKISGSEQLEEVTAVRAEHRHSYRHRDSDTHVVSCDDRLAHADAHPLGNLAGFHNADFWQQRDKFLAAKPADEIGPADEVEQRG